MYFLLMAALLQGVSMPIQTIDRGPASAIETPRQAVARTPQEWAELWRAHAPGRPAPAVDVSGGVVVAVFLGTRPTAGFSVEIVRTRLTGASMVVEYRQKPPDANAMVAQVLTSPYHIATIPAHVGPIVFERVEQ